MSSPENPFLTSIKAFRQELSDDGRAQFCEVDSAEAMIQHLRTELKISQDSVVYRHLKSLAAVSKSWEPYFEITGILVATKAAIAAPFWGALRLIFQLSRNYEALFEQLSVKFAEISEIVEFSTQYVKLFEVVKTIVSGDKHAMIAALLTIYESVIMFCHRAYSIFAQGKKSWRKRMAFHAKAAWVPFQDLFVTLIQRLENARLRFDHEVELLRTKVIVDTGDHVKGELEVLERGILELRSSLEAKHYGSTREQAKLTGPKVYRSLVKWTSSPPFSKIFDIAKRNLQSGSLDWFLNTPIFQHWLHTTARDPGGSVVPFEQRVVGVFGTHYALVPQIYSPGLTDSS